MKTIALSFQSIALPRLKAKSLTNFAICLFLAAVFGFIWQNSKLVSDTYKLFYLQAKLNDLRKQNQALEVDSFRQTGLASMETKIAELGMEKVGEISFIQSLDQTVVRR